MLDAGPKERELVPVSGLYAVHSDHKQPPEKEPHRMLRAGSMQLSPSHGEGQGNPTLGRPVAGA